MERASRNTTELLLENSMASMNGTDNISLPLYWASYERLHRVYYIATGICMGVSSVLGALGNILIIITFLSSRRLKTICNWFLVNLAIADFLASTVGYPVMTAASFIGYWPFGQIVCSSYAVIIGICSFASIGSMVMVALDRALVIHRSTRPLSRASLTIGSTFGPKTAGVAILIIWLYSFALSVPPVAGWSTYVLDAMAVSCTFDYVSEDISAKFYLLFIVLTGFALPLTVIVGCYIYIYRRLHTYSRGFRKQSNADSPRSVSKYSEVRMVKIGMTIVIMFTAAWSPYAVISLAAAFGDIKITPWLQCMAGLFAKASAIYNPVLYSISHPYFRREIVRMIYRRRTSTPTSNQHGIGCSRGQYLRGSVELEMLETNFEINLNLNIQQRTRTVRRLASDNSIIQTPPSPEYL